jgi:energy-coupling factor transport system permease protein
MTTVRPRHLHPGAWWVWALGLAAAATRTTNLLLLATIVAVAAVVVAARRTDEAWSHAFRAALFVGAGAIIIHLVIEAMFGAPVPGHVIVTLPQATLPDVFVGVRVGGPVTLEGLLGALGTGAQFATIIACLGAANALASPARLLKSVPGAVHEIGVAVVVSLTIIPEALTQLQEVRRARRLRGREDRGLRGVAASLGPVLHGCLERALGLAAAMDSRGYGRASTATAASRRLVSGLVLAGMLGVIVGSYALLDAAIDPAAAGGLLAVGVVVALVGFTVAGRRVTRTVYRPDPWRRPEWLVAGSGLVAAVTAAAAAVLDPVAMNPPSVPLTWPSIPLLATVGVVAGLLPALAAPPVPTPRRVAPPVATTAMPTAAPPRQVAA